MKFRNLLIPALVFAVMMSTSSCLKKYTCVCSIVYSGQPGLPDSTIHEFSITDTKSAAKNKCTGQSGTYTNNYIHTVETCVLY